MKYICVDAGFLIALYDENDQYHNKAEEYFPQYFEGVNNCLLVPWPALYETVSTRMVRRRKSIELMRKNWEYLNREQKLILLDDSPYRERAVFECYKELERPLGNYRSLSLVDRVIRNILAEINIKIDCFITFNQRDFVDICSKYHRVIIG